MFDVPAHFPEQDLSEFQESTHGFQVTGYRLELTGYCTDCTPSSQANSTQVV
jgi:Fe2+ or Zn2+ uptake regulation protein